MPPLAICLATSTMTFVVSELGRIPFSSAVRRSPLIMCPRSPNVSPTTGADMISDPIWLIVLVMDCHSGPAIISDAALVKAPTTSLLSIFMWRTYASLISLDMERRAMFSCSGRYQLHTTFLLNLKSEPPKSFIVQAPVEFVSMPAIFAMSLATASMTSAPRMTPVPNFPTEPTTGTLLKAPVTFFMIPATSPKP